MKQKSLIFLVASWLVVRLRMSILTSRLVLHHLLIQPAIILVARRENRLPAERWIFDQERAHIVVMSSSHEPIHVRALPKIGRN